MFSGCGGRDLGAETTGAVEVVWANDTDRWACETYCATSTAAAEEPVKTGVVNVAGARGPCRGPEHGVFEAFSGLPAASRCRPPEHRTSRPTFACGASSASALLRDHRQVLPDNGGSFRTIGNAKISEDAVHCGREQFALYLRDLHQTLFQPGSQCRSGILH
jgi:hypothetical protein